MVRIAVLFIVLLGACNQKNQYPVQDFELGPDYYITLLGEVEDKLEDSRNDQKIELLYKKLFVSQQLRWPEDLSEEIRFLIGREGMNYELYQYAADFYKTNHYYERLLNLVTTWIKQHPVTSMDHRLQIIALTGLNRDEEAKHLLWSFLQSKHEKNDLKFIADQYLSLQDTARALYAYSQLARQYPQEKVLRDSYIPLLLEAGYPEKARDLLLVQSELSEDPKNQELMARILFDLGETAEAIEILRNQNNPKNYLQLARWFQSLNVWDSAIYYTDLLIAKDSSRQALLTKGSIYEERGWLNSAYQTFNALAQQDPTDSIAINRADIVARKIAYLRRKREAEKEIPILNIPKKKSTENE